MLMRVSAQQIVNASKYLLLLLLHDMGLKNTIKRSNLKEKMVNLRDL